MPGETQDIALMFVPSESVYADLHDGFDDLVQKAYRARVMIVSPTLLMLAIQVVQQIQKDAEMREAADLIRTEVGHMMKDVGLLGERVRKLQTHFGQTNEDIERHPDSTGQDREARRPRSRNSSSTATIAPSAQIIPAPVRAGSRPANKTMTASPGTAPPRPSFLDALAVYLQAARADRAVPRLLVRPAAGAVGRRRCWCGCASPASISAPSACSRWSARPTP